MVNGHEEIERARSALFFLDPGIDRASWVRVGMAAKAAGLPCDDFTEWSERADNFGGGKDCRDVWNSFKAGGIGAGTLFQMARDAGWRDERAQASQTATRAVTARQTTKAEKPRGPTAEAVWAACEAATDAHPYIRAKDGSADGLRVYPSSAPPLVIAGQNCAAALVVPVRTLSGELVSLQFIPPAGKKLNLPGHEMRGVFIVGELQPDGRAYLVEGVGQAWAVWKATGAAAVCVFGAGQMRARADELRKAYPALRMVLVPDRSKEADAARIAADCGAQVVNLPESMPNNADANDYAREHGHDGLEHLLSHSSEPPQRFHVMSADELARRPALPWLVKGVLPRRGIGSIFGPPGSGKTFLALDLIAAVASGRDWFGHRVKAAPVLYLGLEGEGGLSQRVRAFQTVKRCLAHFITAPLDVRIASDRAELLKSAKRAGWNGGLLVVDTLNRAAPGFDENAAADMGNVIAALKALEAQTGGLVLVVHHTGKDSTKGLRGHSSLLAALDVALEVKRNGDAREWTTAKAKDGEDGGAFPFRLSPVEVGKDEDGEPVTSCTVNADLSPVEMVKQARKSPGGANQKIALPVLRKLIRDEGIERGCGPFMSKAVPLERALKAVAAAMPCNEKRQKERADAAVTGLMASKHLHHREGMVWML